MKGLLLWLMLLCPTFLWAQYEPNINNISPPAHEVGVYAWTDIVIDFDTTLSTTSVTNQNVRVFGRWSGPVDGALSVENSAQRIRFTPNQAFFPGEQVTVMLGTGLKSYPQLGGDFMEEGYAWSFWIDALPGPLDLYPIDTIEVRLPSEGWIQSYGAYAGDLNNDGHSDLAVFNELSNDMRVFLNDGQGFYPTMATYGVKGGNKPSPNEGGDFNHDGEIDIAVGNTGNSHLTVIYGDGAGGILTDSVNVSGDEIRAVAVLDLDGDASEDIAVTHKTDDNIGLLVNDGTGSFNSLPPFDAGQSGEHAMCAADMNNDGLIDLVVGGHTSEDIVVILNGGSAGLTALPAVSAMGNPWMLGAGDLNGDGNADIVSANSNANVVMVAFGDGNGGLTNMTTYPTGDFPLAVDLGDLDGDGDLDLVTSNYAGVDFTLFENDGTGNFVNPRSYAAKEAGSCAIFHDRNSDGDLDLTVVDELADIIIPFDDDSTIAVWSVQEEAVRTLLTTRPQPNPSVGAFSIQAESKGNDRLQLQILDAFGRVVYRAEVSLQDGRNTIALPELELASGKYFYRLQSDTQVGYGSIILLD